jgi:hypothetical protein
MSSHNEVHKNITMNVPPEEQANEQQEEQRQQHLPPNQGQQVISDAESSHVHDEEPARQEGVAAAQELPRDHRPYDPEYEQHAQAHAAAEAHAHLVASHQQHHQQHEPLPPIPPPPPPTMQMQGHPALAMAQFYEARMRDHAAAYASAAANAAWAAAQVAAAAAEFASGTGPPPASLGIPMPPWNMYHGPQHPTHPQPQPPPPHPHGASYQYVPWFPPQEGMGGGEPDGGAYGESWQQSPYQEQAEEEFESSSDHADSRRHRRKRQQRMPPGAQQNVPPQQIQQQSQQSQQPQQLQQLQQQQQGRGKIRRRLRSDGDSSSDGNTLMSSRRSYHNKKKARSDESLLGKTAVAALYEWCNKRQRTPSFVFQQATDEEFDFTVFSEDGKEWGHGRARTKHAAKQEAARKALQALLPGVVFDEATGILIELPRQRERRGRTESAASLEELAPNLAKRLAIGHDDDCAEEKKADSKKRCKTSLEARRVRDVYPGTSTTSEDEDENTYYAFRGASVCSALLHAMIQIDSRIPDAPEYTYEVSPLPPSARDSQLERKVSSSKSVARAARGSFACTAQLTLQSTLDQEGMVLGIREEDAAGATVDDAVETKEYSSRQELQEETLKTVGVGGTKREARHVASAKLLALLFPDCNSMVEVKAAAEAVREEYAAKKALKQQAANSTFRRRGKDRLDRDAPNFGRSLSPTLAVLTDPPLPSSLKRELEKLSMLEPAECYDEDDVEDADAVSQDGSTVAYLLSQGSSDATESSSESIFRQLSRRKLLDAQVELALQAFNDRDEGGRSLRVPDELTVDDVGRTILRRAEPDDLPRIRKLLATGGSGRRQNDSPVVGPIALLAIGDKFAKDSLGIQSDLAARLWSQSSVVVLLCRAIAAYEDPPLGCAVLTLGFSMERGRVLRLAEIASETHLPRERFVECLEGFSSCMHCGLELEREKKTGKRFATEDLKAIVESHVNNKSDKHVDGKVAATPLCPTSESIKRVSSPLQSVREESEGSDSSGVEHHNTKRSSKSSKRSRVE